MDVVLIAAVAENNVIGVDGEMPWDIPEDLKHFKEETMGSPVIMGRRTFESIVARSGGPLTDRMNIVLSSDPGQFDAFGSGDDGGLDELADATSVHGAGSVDEALALAATDESSTVYIAGGASVYEQYLPVADRMVLTEIWDTYDGDTEFPEWDSSQWREVTSDDRDGFSFVRYERDM